MCVCVYIYNSFVPYSKRFIPESPRWLILKGRHEEAETILRKMGKLNKHPLPDDFNIRELHGDDSEQPTGSLIDVLKKPRLRARALICSYCWYEFTQNIDIIG